MTIRENEEKKAILQQLRQLSEYYTPNWDPAKPGAASALAELFAELMAQNSAELSSIWERHHLMYLNMYGLKQNNASPASGYVCVMPTSENSVYIPSGTRLSSASDVEFVTTEELNASNAQISAVFYAADNYISKGNTEKLFDFCGTNTTHDYTNIPQPGSIRHIYLSHSQSSIVFASQDVISVELGEGRDGGIEQGVASFDGAARVPMVTGDRIVISKAKKDTKIIKINNISFLEVLREKMSNN